MKEPEENKDKVNEEIVNLLKPSSEVEVDGITGELIEENDQGWRRVK